MSAHIAVFDIGKTNKKLLIYDDALSLVDSAVARLPEFVEMGVHFERVEEITEWYLEQLAVFGKLYNIRAVSIASQGSSCVCIDKSGSIAVPPVAYTTDPGEDFHHRFYEHFGSIEEIQRKTASAPMGNLLNMAQLIQYLKETYIEGFKQVDTILGFPGYFGYVLTGKTGAEPTYIGCHTFLWDCRENKWSFVAEKMGITDKLPPGLSNSWDILGTITPDVAEQTGLHKDTIVTLGIHDSNASLLPYIIKYHIDFALDSTGTWCAVMHPQKEVSFAKDEIGKIVFYNLDIHSHPIKTSVFLGGLEFETWSELIKHIGLEQNLPPFQPEIYRQVMKDKDRFIFPGIIQGTGQFPESKPRVFEQGTMYTLEEIRKGKIPSFFSDYPTAIAVLNLSLAVQTKVAMDRVGVHDGTPIFIEGGFYKNPDYCSLLTAMYPHSEVFLSNLDEATAFGAALIGKAALAGSEPEALADLFEIEKTPVPHLTNFEEIEGYTAAFLDLLK